MKKDIHPDYVLTEVTCTCGNTFTTRSTAKNGIIHADVCSNCHPFYTGKQKILDTGGRVARFEARYAKKADRGPKSRQPTPSSSATTPATAPRGRRRSFVSSPDPRRSRPCSRPWPRWSTSTPTSSGSSPSPRRTPTRGWPRGSTSGTPS